MCEKTTRPGLIDKSYLDSPVNQCAMGTDEPHELYEARRLEERANNLRRFAHLREKHPEVVELIHLHQLLSR